MARTGVGKTLVFFVDLLVVASVAALAGAAFYISRGVLPELPEWVPFAGRLHPVVLHVPLGALVLIALVEIIRGFRGKEALDTLCIFLVVASAYLAACAGLALSLEGGYEENRLSYHMWLAVCAYGAAGLAFLLRLRVDPEELAGPGAYRLALLLSAGLIGVAGHFGGTLTHGSNYLTEHADAALVALGLAPRPADIATAEPEPAAPSTAYEAHIVPILEGHCYECHSGEKFKGGLQLDTLEHILKGGDSGVVVQPENAADSLLVQRISLPLDDLDHMPPEGKPQPTDAHIDLLRWWVQAGASADILADAAPGAAPEADLAPTPSEPAPEAEAEPTPEPAPVTAPEAFPVPEPAPAPEALPDPVAEPESAPVSARESLAEPLAAYQAEYPGALNWVAEDSDQIAFTAVSFRNEFDDAALAKLEPFADHLIWVDLSGTQITAEGLGTLLPKLTAVERLNLSGTELDPKSLMHLAPEAPLAVLNLFDSAADDGTLVVLAARSGLERLYVGRTGITPAAIDGLTTLIPGCEVIGEVTYPAPAVPVEPVVAEVVEASVTEEPKAAETKVASADSLDYAAHIAPIFEANCLKCHGPSRQRGGLRLDSMESILAGGNSGPVVLAGDTAASELVRRISLPLDDDDHMPPSQAAQPTAAQIEQLRAWVASGNLSGTPAEATATEEAEAEEPTEAQEKPAEETPDTPAETAPDPDAPVDAAPVATAASAYEAHIAPIFAENCAGCHGAEKQKAGLRLDAIESILKGSDAGPVVLAGDADGSLLIQRVSLPLEDLDHMPPENAPQPSEAQLALLRWWVDAGATPETSARELPPDLISALEQ